MSIYILFMNYQLGDIIKYNGDLWYQIIGFTNKRLRVRELYMSSMYQFYVDKDQCWVTKYKVMKNDFIGFKKNKLIKNDQVYQIYDGKEQVEYLYYK